MPAVENDRLSLAPEKMPAPVVPGNKIVGLVSVPDDRDSTPGEDIVRVPVIVSPALSTLLVAAPVTVPVKLPVTLPVRLAVIVLAEKFPEESRKTIVFGVFAPVAVVAEFATFPAVAIVASFVSDIAAVLLILAFVTSELERFPEPSFLITPFAVVKYGIFTVPVLFMFNLCTPAVSKDNVSVTSE